MLIALNLPSGARACFEGVCSNPLAMARPIAPNRGLMFQRAETWLHQMDDLEAVPVLVGPEAKF